MKTVLTFIFLGVLCACSAPNRPVEGEMVGAYRNTDDDDRARVERIGRFAVLTEAARSKTNLSFVRILGAQSQVVAGVNYRVQMTVRDGGKQRNAVAVVWQKLSGDLELTSWDWQD